MFSSTRRQAASSTSSLFLSVRCLTLSLSQFWSEHNLFRPFFKATHMPALGFPGASAVKNPPAKAGDTGEVGAVPGSGGSAGGGNGNPLQYSRLENSMDRGARRATVPGVAKIQT